MILYKNYSNTRFVLNACDKRKMFEIIIEGTHFTKLEKQHLNVSGGTGSGECVKCQTKYTVNNNFIGWRDGSAVKNS